MSLLVYFLDNFSVRLLLALAGHRLDVCGARAWLPRGVAAPIGRALRRAARTHRLMPLAVIITRVGSRPLLEARVRGREVFLVRIQIGKFLLRSGDHFLQSLRDERCGIFRCVT